MLRKIAALTVAIALGAIVAGCGGGSGEKADVAINLKAENNRFVPDRIEVPAGKTVKLTLQNLDLGDHDLEVKGLSPKVSSGGGHGGMDMDKSSPMGALTVHSQGKKSASVTFVADRPGTYEVICTQQGHKEVGMVGTLIVTGERPAAIGGATNPTPASPPPPPTATAGQSSQMPAMQPPSGGGHEGH